MLLQRSLILAALLGAAACDPQSPSREAPKVSDAPVPDTVQRTAAYHAEVLFEFERAELAAEGRKLLDELARKLVADDLEWLNATAHSDRIGRTAYNERLSARRADAIRAYLAGQGVAEERMRFESRGAREPVTAGRCEAMGPENRQNEKLVACLQPDRRVEIDVREKAAR